MKGFGAVAVMTALVLAVCTAAGGRAADARRDCRGTAARQEPRAAADRAGRSRAGVPEALGRTRAGSSLQPASRLLRRASDCRSKARRSPPDRPGAPATPAATTRSPRRPPRRSAANGSVSSRCRFPTRCPRLGNDRFFADVVGLAIGTGRERVLGTGQLHFAGGQPTRVPCRADRRRRDVRRAADAVAERVRRRCRGWRRRSRTPLQRVLDHRRVRRVDGAGPDQTAAVLQVRDRRRSRLPRFDAADPDGRPPRSPAARRARRAVDATRSRWPRTDDREFESILVPQDHGRPAAVRAAAARPPGARLSRAGRVQRHVGRTGGAVLPVADATAASTSGAAIPRFVSAIGTCSRCRPNIATRSVRS